MTALIADPDLRTRDERFAEREHHTSAPNPLHDKSGSAKKGLPLFTPRDFTYDAEARTCVSPAGKSLYRKGASNVTKGYVGEHCRGTKRDCAPCAQRTQCLRALGLHTPYPIGIHTDTHMHTDKHTHSHRHTHAHTHAHTHTHTHTDDYVILKQMHLYYRKFYFYFIDSYDLWLFG